MSLKILQHMQNLLKKSEKFCDKENNLFIQNVLEVIENIDFAFLQNDSLIIKEKKIKESYLICL